MYIHINTKPNNFIICVQEPYYVFRQRHARKPKSCNTYCTLESPRTAIYTSNQSNTWCIESLSTRDFTVIQAKIKSRETLIVSGYLDNNRGDTLDDFIAAHNLKIENQGTEYAFKTSMANSVIYITLSDKLAVSVMNWSVEKGENFTEHNDITFILETEKVLMEKN